MACRLVPRRLPNSSKEMSLSIQLLIADPHPAMLDGLLHVFAAEPDFAVVGGVTDGEAALQALQESRPDVLVLDLFLPRRSGLELLAAIRDAELPTRPVVFTASPSPEIVEAIRLGVRGVVTKDMPLELLVRCIREVAQGGRWLEKGAATGALQFLINQVDGGERLHARLTPRELTVARMVGEGLPNKRIASRLAISEGTAKLHLHRVYQKLHVSGRMELMNYLRKAGVL